MLIQRSFRGKEPSSSLRATAKHALLLCCLPALAASGCFRPDDGREPPLDRIYFPTGAVLNEDASRLYVANSNWDLQFNAGSVQAYDTQAIRQLLPTYCDADSDCDGGGVCALDGGDDPTIGHWCVSAPGEDPCLGRGIQNAARRLVSPGLCAPLDNRSEELLLDSVGIGAFATDLAYRSNPRGGGRLFLPVRSDATLTWIDVEEENGGSASLQCGQDNPGEDYRRGHCDSNHRRGDDRNERSLRQEGLPIEPFGLAVSKEGSVVVTSHQSSGSLGLFLNQWDGDQPGPALQSVFEDLVAREVLAVAPIPVAQAAESSADYQPGFLVSYRQRSILELVRYYDGQNTSDGVPFLQSTRGSLAVAPAGDIRSIAIDDSRRRSCESECSASDEQCSDDCAATPLKLYLANQFPASVLVGNTFDERPGGVPSDEIQVSSKLSIASAPTKVTMGAVQTNSGVSQPRVFALSFGASTIAIIDPATNQVEKTVFTGRGPTALAIDEERGLGFVTHFTDSYLGVVDLNRDHATYGTIMLSLGIPTAPRGDQ